MNKYGAMAMGHWKRWLPTRFQMLEDPEMFFAELGDEISEKVVVLMDELAGEGSATEGFLERAGRLGMARFRAEEIILRETALLEPEDAMKDPEDLEEPVTSVTWREDLEDQDDSL